MSDAFDWNETENENVVVRTQMAIAVYLNPCGELVIRQEGQFHPDEDVFIVIAPGNVPAVIAAMTAAAGLMPPAAIAPEHGDLPLLRAV